MDWRNLHGVIDVSPFMLFESTGDSEEDSDQTMSSFDDDNMEVSYEIDDAQSCCSDSSEIYGDYNVRDHFTSYSRYTTKNDQENVHHQDQNDEYDNDEDEDEDDGVIDQVCSRRELGFVFSKKQKKNKVYADSTIEPLKKEENDKLFWDTCLAS